MLFEEVGELWGEPVAAYQCGFELFVEDGADGGVLEEEEGLEGDGSDDG